MRSHEFDYKANVTFYTLCLTPLGENIQGSGGSVCSGKLIPSSLETESDIHPFGACKRTGSKNA